MPRRNPNLGGTAEDAVAASEHQQRRKTDKPKRLVERQVAEEGRRLAELLADDMSEEVLLRRACERRGRSVIAVRAEAQKVLKSRHQ
jgi:hypothetical protein